MPITLEQVGVGVNPIGMEEAVLHTIHEEEMAEQAELELACIRLHQLNMKELRILARHYFGGPHMGYGGKDNLVRDLAECLVQDGR